MGWIFKKFLMFKSRLQTVLWIAWFAVLGVIVCFFAFLHGSSPKSNFENLLKISQTRYDCIYYPGIMFSRNFDTFHKLEKVLHIEGEDDILSKLNCSSIPFVVLIVFSSPHNIPQRAAIRATWASKKNSISETKFLIGLGEIKKPLANKLREEQSINGDLLFGEFVDSYDNLSVKAMTMLKWISKTKERGSSLKCSNPQFLMKVDDDTFLNMDEVVKLLTTLRHKSLALGSVITGAELIPWNDHMEAIRYPDYLSGSAYVLSLKGVEDILKVADEVKPFWLEDVYISGFLTERAGVPLLNSHKFQAFNSHFDPCSGQISSHKISPKKMTVLYNILLKSEKYCRYVQNNNN